MVKYIKDLAAPRLRVKDKPRRGNANIFTNAGEIRDRASKIRSSLEQSYALPSLRAVSLERFASGL